MLYSWHERKTAKPKRCSWSVPRVEPRTSFFLRNAEGESLTSIAKSVGAHTTTITRAVQRVKKFNYIQDLKCDDGQ